MARLNRRQCTISFASKLQLYKSLVTSILLYGCQTWTLLDDSEKEILAFETQVPEETSPHPLHGAQDQRLGVEQDQLHCDVGPQEPLLAPVKRGTLACFGACHTP